MNVRKDDVRDELLGPLLVAYDEALAHDGPLPEVESAVDDRTLAVELHGARRCLELLDRVRRLDATLTGLDLSTGHGVRPAADSVPVTADTLGAVGTARPAMPRQIGRFTIERELGRGGLGVVFLAQDPDLGRAVAVKIPRVELLTNGEIEQRFFREAEAAARLNHPHLIALHEVGRDGPLVYLVTEYCPGVTLADWLRAQPGSVSPRQSALLIEQLAGAVHHAHSRGVLHRDIKPSNVLLNRADADAKPDAAAVPWPKLTDFGMARLLESADGHTRTGVVLGTPAYMAPEQADGQAGDVDIRADIYALGAVLYELLTGRPPYRGVSDIDTLRQLLLAEPTTPRTINPAIPRDLEAITQKCLSKLPAERYATAYELAEDLRRFLAGQPTVARPLTAPARLWKWARRRPAWAALAALSVFATVTMIAGTLIYDAKLRAAFARAEQSAEVSHDLLYGADLRLANDAVRAQNMQEARDILARQIPGPEDADRREFAWHWQWQQLHRQVQTLDGHAGDVYRVVFLPDHERIATAGADGTIRVWELDTGKVQRVIRGHQGEVNNLVVVGDDQIASAGDDGTVRLWKSSTGEPQRVLKAGTGAVFGLAWSEARGLASGGQDGVLRVWNPASGNLEWESTPEERIESIAFLSDGESLVTSHHNGLPQIWNRTSHVRLPLDLQDHLSPSNIAASSDFLQVATLVRSGNLRVLCQRSQQWETSRRYDLPSTASGANAIKFSPRDNSLAVGTKDGLVHLYLAGSSDEVFRTISGHGQRVWDVAWNSDGTLLASCSADGTVKIWNVMGTDGPRVYPSVKASIRGLAVSPDGTHLTTVDSEGVLREWERSSFTCVQSRRAFAGDAGNVQVAIRYVRGREVLVLGPSGVVKQLNWDSGELVPLLHCGSDCRVAISADCRTIAYWKRQQDIALFDRRSGRELRTIRPKNTGQVNALALSADGRHLALMNTAVELVDLATGRHDTLTARATNLTGHLLFSPDGRRLIVGGGDAALRVWDTATRELQMTIVGQAAAVVALDVSPDGRTLATYGKGQSWLALWDLESGSRLATLEGMATQSNTLAFSADGHAVVAAHDTSEGQLFEWSIDPPTLPEGGSATWMPMQRLMLADGVPLLAVFEFDSRQCEASDKTYRIKPIVDFLPADGDGESTLRFNANWTVGFQVDNPTLPTTENESEVVTLAGRGGQIIDRKTLAMPVLPEALVRRPDGRYELRLAFASLDGTALADQDLKGLVREVRIYRDLDADRQFNPAIDIPVGRAGSEAIQHGIQTVAVDTLDIEPSEANAVSWSHLHCAELVQAAHDYARRQGCVTGYPNFRIFDQADGAVAEIVLIRGDAKTIRVTAAELGVRNETLRCDFACQADLLWRCQHVMHVWAHRHGYNGALPTLRALVRPGLEDEYEVTLLRDDCAWRCPISKVHLGPITDIVTGYREVQAFAASDSCAAMDSPLNRSAKGGTEVVARRGYLAGIPTFEKIANEFPAVMLPAEVCEVVRVPLRELRLQQESLP